KEKYSAVCVRQNSVAVSGNAVYVANRGDGGANAANISGFEMKGSDITAIAGSNAALSVAAPNPTDIRFSPDGKLLVVMERGTSKVATFTVNAAGVAGGAKFQAASGQQPFAFGC